MAAKETLSKKEVGDLSERERERVREVIRKIRDEICKSVSDKIENLKEINQRFEDQVPLSFFHVAFPDQHQKLGIVYPNTRENVYKRLIVADFIKTKRSEGASADLSDVDILCRHISKVLMSYLSYHFVPSDSDLTMNNVFTEDVRKEVLKYFIDKTSFDYLLDLAPYSYLAAQLVEDMKKDFHKRRRAELTNLLFWSCLFKRRWYFSFPVLKMDISFGIVASASSAPRLTCTIVYTGDTRTRLFIKILDVQKEKKKDFISPPFLEGFETNITAKEDDFQVLEKTISFKICDDEAYLNYLKTPLPRGLCKSLILLNVVEINTFLSRFVAFITTEGIDLKINVNKRDHEIPSFFGMKTVAQRLLGESDYEPQTVKDLKSCILKGIKHPWYAMNIRDATAFLLEMPRNDVPTTTEVLAKSESAAILIMNGLLNACPEISKKIPEIADVLRGCYEAQLLFFDIEDAMIQFGIFDTSWKQDWKFESLRRSFSKPLLYKKLRKELGLDESANLALRNIPNRPLDMGKIPAMLLMAASLGFWEPRIVAYRDV